MRPSRPSPWPVPLLRLGAMCLLSVGCGSPEVPRTAGSAAAESRPAPDSIVGSWRPRDYRLAAGATLPVDGRIVFLPGEGEAASGEWSVVTRHEEDDGTAVRGSAEGGAWFREGDSLLLTHQYHLSAGEAAGPLPAAPLRMALRSAAEADRNHREPCEVAVEGDRLTLFFPSGNAMTFERVARLR